MSSGNYESVFDNDSVRVKLADTEDGIALSLDLMEDGESTAGTTLYLGKEQIDGMCAWLDKYRTPRTEALPMSEAEKLLRRIANAGIIFPSYCVNNGEAWTIVDELKKWKETPPSPLVTK